jgi:RNA recognition motif-containing protein
VRRRIFVDNCAPSTTPQNLRELFADAGEVTSIEIPPGRAGSSPVGHAFVVMASVGEAAAAIQMLNGTDWQGKKITVTHANAFQTHRGFRGGSSSLERKNR